MSRDELFAICKKEYPSLAKKGNKVETRNEHSIFVTTQEGTGSRYVFDYKDEYTFRLYIA